MAQGPAADQETRQHADADQVQPSGRRRQATQSRPHGRKDHLRAVPCTEVRSMVNRLVERYGRTGFAALSSVIWALPMAAWAGSPDLSPLDKTADPWGAPAIGLVMLVVWLVLLTRPRPVSRAAPAR